MLLFHGNVLSFLEHSGNVQSMDAYNDSTKVDEIYSFPEYFVLEQENEPVTETSSVSETDAEDDDEEEKGGKQNGLICIVKQKQEDNELQVNKSSNEYSKPVTRKEFESKTQIQNNDNEERTMTKENTIENMDTVKDDEDDSDDDTPPSQDFCIIEDDMSSFCKKVNPYQTVPVKFANDLHTVENLSIKMPCLQNDGFAAMMEGFDGFTELVPKPGTNLNTNEATDDALTELNNIPSISVNIKEDNLPGVLPTEFSNVEEEEVCVESDELSKSSDLTGRVSSENITPDIGVDLKVTENKIFTEKKEKEDKNDIPRKSEIPLTFPARRFKRRQNGVRSVSIPLVSTDIPVPNLNQNAGNPLANTKDSLDGNTKSIPASFFVEEESPYKVDLQNEHDIVSPNGNNTSTCCSTDAVGNSGNDTHIYEVPLKICADTYASLENNSDNGLDSTFGNMSLLGSISDEEYRDKTLPIPDASKHIDPTQKSAKRTSSASNNRTSFDNSNRIPPLRGKRKENRKPSALKLIEESKKDIVNNSWYVVSIGSGHVDLRKATKYNENLNLLNSSSFEGHEPMILLWRLNAGNSFYR